MHIRPVSFSGQPANLPGGLHFPPNSLQSFESAHPHSNSRDSFPVYVVPVTSSIPIDPSLAYTEHPTWIASVQYANTLPLSPSHRHSYAGGSFHPPHPLPEVMTSIPEQDRVLPPVPSMPEITTPESRPLPKSLGGDASVRQRQRAEERSPTSAQVSTGGQLPHSSSTFTLADL
ncbi:hypothetical protein BCR44DRAFT_1446555 [Catenaria anguillulae PL171]|uniref:Uncharacterized protein n=1 Tax=Catenaria anguillulae PL171 TaxID=765915 RepID=A0A1Y2H7T5_9FUNG|nr:hypothetical protein BCR44DRAFT_1446555 [Catenaria anguillulae PL171]